MMIITKPSDTHQPDLTQRTGVAPGVRPTAAGSPIATGEERVESREAATGVTLSDASRTMIASSGDADINESKVAELRQAIEEGRYRPNAERIAARMLADQTELSKLAAG